MIHHQLALLLACVVASSVCAFNVTMASVGFLGSYANSAADNEREAVTQLEALLVRNSSSSSDMLAVPEGYFWWYLPTREMALEAASLFVLVVDGKTTASKTVTPCDDEDESKKSLLSTLSCLARKHDTYLAVNLATKSCNHNDHNNNDGNQCQLWNTEMVFDRTGRVQATYRKSHVYGGSPQFDSPARGQYDVSWFHAVSRGQQPNSGSGIVKVGLLVCFDLEFTEPAHTLVHAVGVDAVLMSQYWVNTPPVSWSILYQQAWSLNYPGVTLIAVNDGNNAQTWGAGAYRSGQLVSDAEAFSVVAVAVVGEDRKEEREEEGYTHILSVSVAAADAGVPDTESPPMMTMTKMRAGSSTGSFPCVVAAYGTGNCVKLLPATGNGDDRQAAAVAHKEAECSIDIDMGVSPGGSGSDIGENDGYTVAMAIDTEVAVGGTAGSLHLLVCSIFTCMSSQEVGGGDVVQCSAQYGSGFRAKSVSMTMVSSSSSSSSTGPPRYQQLPMAADAAWHTLNPKHLQWWTQGNATLAVDNPPQGMLSVVSIFAVDQR
jgi:predicted amidohydrolase